MKSNFAKKNSGQANMFKLFKDKDESLQKEEELFEKEKSDFIHNFNEEMFESNLYSKSNKTYELNIYEKTNYGFKATMKLPKGLDFYKFQECKQRLQQTLSCLFLVDFESNSNEAEVRIILNPIDFNVVYGPYKMQPYEIYLGMSYSNEPVIVDSNKFNMFLFAGAVGAGKTRFLYTVLLSWILSCKVDEVGLYISDIAKKEFGVFESVPCVRCYADELEKLRDMTRYLYEKIDYRTSIIEEYRLQGIATNIKEYNEIKGVDRMSYDYLLIDEFSLLMPDRSDNKEEQEMKEETLALIKKITKLGRALGIFVINCTQKTTKDEMPSIIKSMSSVRLSFRANDSISSEVIMGNQMAVGLKDRLAVYSLNGGTTQDYLYCPRLETSYMTELLSPYKRISHSKPNLKLLTEEMKNYVISLKENKKNNNGFRGIKPKTIQESSNVSDNLSKCSNSKGENPAVMRELAYDVQLPNPNIKVKEDTTNYLKTEKPRKKVGAISSGWERLR